MLSAKKIKEQLFNITSEADFNTLALAIFHYQYNHNKVYRDYVLSIHTSISEIQHYTQIPFLPIHFFKSKQIVCDTINENAICFSSSATTGQTTSKHYVNDISLYETSFKKGFELFYGEPSDYCILALLPNYLDRSGSSLVYMFNQLINDSENSLSSFYLTNYEDLVKVIDELKRTKQKTLLLGVTYALLDLADKGIELGNQFIVMETGGMKGKRQEMIKEDLHVLLKEKFKINAVHSEYGMTELLSQAYSKEHGIFECPPWMKVLVRETNDPFSYTGYNRTGGINVIDLANLYSCSFIETKDLGKVHANNTFEIIGRFDNSDIRGCNLMID